MVDASSIIEHVVLVEGRVGLVNNQALRVLLPMIPANGTFECSGVLLDKII